VFEGLADLAGAGVKVAKARQDEKDRLAKARQDEKDKLDFSEGLSAFTAAASAASIEAANDPNIDGSANRLRERLRETLDTAVQNAPSRAVAVQLEIDGSRRIDAIGVTGDQTENRRFTAHARVKVDQFTDVYIQAFGDAPNTLVEDQIREAHENSIQISSVIDSTFQDQQRDRFVKGVLKSRSIRQLATDPKALLVSIESGELDELPAIEVSRLFGQALNAADRNIRQAEAAASRNVKDSQLAADSALQLQIEEGLSENEALAIIQANPQNYNGPSIRVLMRQFDTEPVSTNPTENIRLDKLVFSDDPTAETAVSDAYAKRQITEGTWNSFRARIRNRSGGKASPYSQAESFIEKALGPGAFDRFLDRSVAATRKFNASQEFAVAFADAEDRSPANVADIARAIVKSYVQGELTDVLRSARPPFGSPPGFIMEEVTTEDLDRSTNLVKRQKQAGKLSLEQGVIELQNIAALRSYAQAIEAERRGSK
jgi:hypothetical protein